MTSGEKPSPSKMLRPASNMIGFGPAIAGLRIRRLAGNITLRQPEKSFNCFDVNRLRGKLPTASSPPAW